MVGVELAFLYSTWLGFVAIHFLFIICCFFFLVLLLYLPLFLTSCGGDIRTPLVILYIHKNACICYVFFVYHFSFFIFFFCLIFIPIISNCLCMRLCGSLCKFFHFFFFCFGSIFFFRHKILRNNNKKVCLPFLNPNVHTLSKSFNHCTCTKSCFVSPLVRINSLFFYFPLPTLSLSLSYNISFFSLCICSCVMIVSIFNTVFFFLFCFLPPPTV